ncbi:hypothetical protein AMATHDRAFT_58183 [Amanita thiersii Skay4041]|uniref:Uncharacterized protein n=1 Tax=Amanita thiersii Skay4041 TaxID=703135 RepID=A0A2A9NW80_9AGAR|nr:hypothetical protein AMATHDRAFT_58183 [Amanita thiersii Skay4041]
MDVPIFDKHILDWDESDVHLWLQKLGYPHYETQIRDHSIRGDILVTIDAENLKLLGVSTIGQRLAILKAVYLAKLAYGVPRDDDGYVPPSEASDRNSLSSIDRLISAFEEQAQRLHSVEEDNRSLMKSLHSLMDDFNNLRASIVKPDETMSPIQRQPSFRWAQYVKPQKSPTKADAIESPHPSPQQLEHDIPPYTRNNNLQSHASSSADKPRSQPQPTPDLSNSNSGTAAKKQESTDNLKSFKVSLEDPTWKVLPAALKKYRINNDTWQNYAMFICYGPPGNRIERCLSYDEKPLLLFQKLKDAQKNPVFMLKHIKDIRSPIVVAQQKHAARKASSVASVPSQGHNKQPSTSRSTNRPPKLEVQDLSTQTPLLSSLISPQPGWPEPGVSSPSIDHNQHRNEDTTTTLASVQQSLQGSTSASITGGSSATSTLVSANVDLAKPKTESSEQQSHTHQNNSSSSPREMPIAPNGISYAVAIYPYMAEQEDEFDVVVGDTFVILSRAKGWWVVHRDPTGAGLADEETLKPGWVPAGCLLETNVPVASAIAEATAAKGDTNPDGTNKTPILPLSIISTSYPGIALMDYKKKGEEELDLVKDDALRVFKRYNHWSYAVKEDGGDRGWVPSWFIGKVSTTSTTASSANTPPTPSTSATPHGNPTDEVNGQTQVSPMSSAFPPVQTRV